MYLENERAPRMIPAQHDELVGGHPEDPGQVLLDSLPEVCRTECTIARFVIDQLISEERTDASVGGRLAECPAEPQTIGACSTQKIKCSHPEAGNTDNFAAQVNNLRKYAQNGFVEFTAD